MLKDLKQKLIFKLLDISKIKDWTHTIYWLTKKLAKKVTWAIYRPGEKSYKSTGKLEMIFP